MRRKDREINDPTIIRNIFERGKICRLALFDGHEPYLVPLNYGYSEPYLYFHSAPEGRKIEILRLNPLVCFEIEELTEIVTGPRSCDYTTRYRSIIGYGRAEIIHDEDSIRHGLDVIMKQHGRNEGLEYDQAYFRRMVLIRLRIERVSGKQNGMV